EDHGILWKHQDWRTGLAEGPEIHQLILFFYTPIVDAPSSVSRWQEIKWAP
ncbi:hypothetical protein ACJX0J_036638, partial [Zea mays]